MSIIVGAAMGGRLASTDVLGLVFQAGWVVQLVLLVLLTLSVVSWTIIVYKWRELRRAGQDSEAFLEIYQEGSLDTAYTRARELSRSPLAGIYATAYAELSRMLRFVGKGALEEKHLQALSRHIGWAGSREGLRLERGLNFLATTGSAAPFIGLFGTVIGIINAFATAVGLFAAIPATVFYNYFVGELRGLTAAIDLFTADCEGDLRRHSGARDAAPSARG